MVIFATLVFGCLGVTIVGGALNPCCHVKVVGGVEYTLVDIDSSEARQPPYNCNSNCVYETREGTRYCFRLGGLESECIDNSSFTGALVMMGGNVDGKNYSTNVELIGTCDVETSTPGPPVMFGAAAVFEDKIYFCGGYANNSDNPIDSCTVRYRNGAEIAGPSFFAARAHHTLNVVGTKLVGFQGKDESGFADSRVEILETNTTEWKILFYTVYTTRYDHCTVTVSSKSLVAVGGLGYFDTSMGEEGFEHSTLKLDLTTGDQTYYSNLPVVVHGHACTYHDDCIVLTGGIIDGAISKRVFILNLSVVDDEWTEVASMVYTRSYHAMGKVNGLLTVYSGSGDGSHYMEAYETSGKWVTRLANPTRYGSAYFEIC